MFIQENPLSSVAPQPAPKHTELFKFTSHLTSTGYMRIEIRAKTFEHKVVCLDLRQ